MQISWLQQTNIPYFNLGLFLFQRKLTSRECTSRSVVFRDIWDNSAGLIQDKTLSSNRWGCPSHFLPHLILKLILPGAFVPDRPLQTPDSGLWQGKAHVSAASPWMQLFPEGCAEKNEGMVQGLTRESRPGSWIACWHWRACSVRALWMIQLRNGCQQELKTAVNSYSATRNRHHRAEKETSFSKSNAGAEEQFSLTWTEPNPRLSTICCCSTLGMMGPALLFTCAISGHRRTHGPITHSAGCVVAARHKSEPLRIQLRLTHGHTRAQTQGFTQRSEHQPLLMFSELRHKCVVYLGTKSMTDYCTKKWVVVFLNPEAPPTDNLH